MTCEAYDPELSCEVKVTKPLAAPHLIVEIDTAAARCALTNPSYFLLTRMLTWNASFKVISHMTCLPGTDIVLMVLTDPTHAECVRAKAKRTMEEATRLPPTLLRLKISDTNLIGRLHLSKELTAFGRVSFLQMCPSSGCPATNLLYGSHAICFINVPHGNTVPGKLTMLFRGNTVIMGITRLPLHPAAKPKAKPHHPVTPVGSQLQPRAVVVDSRGAVLQSIIKVQKCVRSFLRRRASLQHQSPSNLDPDSATSAVSTSPQPAADLGWVQVQSKRAKQAAKAFAPSPQQVCSDYFFGICQRGKKCRFAHSIERSAVPPPHTMLSQLAKRLIRVSAVHITDRKKPLNLDSVIVDPVTASNAPPNALVAACEEDQCKEAQICTEKEEAPTQIALTENVAAASPRLRIERKRPGARSRQGTPAATTGTRDDWTEDSSTARHPKTAPISQQQ